MKSLKIYHCVESYHPSLGGMQEVVKRLSELLVRFGHDVTVLTRSNQSRKFTELNGVKIVSFKIEGNPIEPVTNEDYEYVNYLLNLNADVISFFAAQQWATNLALPILDKINAKKVSIPTGYSGLYWPQFNDYYKKMKKYIHGYDMNIYLSNDYRDINFARENKVERITIIPNGASEEEFSRPQVYNLREVLKIDSETKIILHVGSYTGWKGHKEAVEIFLKAKLKNTLLLMIGNNYEYFNRQYFKKPWLYLNVLYNKLLKGNRIIFKFYNRDFTVDAFKQSDLFLFPSNIECSPIVLYECAAAGLPFLSSDSGNAVEINEWIKGGVILPTSKSKDGFSYVDVEKSAAILHDLLNDKVRLKQLSESGNKMWRENFTWELIAKKYEKLYFTLVNS